MKIVSKILYFIMIFWGLTSASYLLPTEESNPSNLSWERWPYGITQRRDHVMVFDEARGVLVIFGGISENGAAYLGDTWEYDGSKWELVATTGPTPRAQAAMVYDPITQKSILFGGLQYNGGGQSDTWEWDGNSWTQIYTSPSNTPEARSDHAMSYDVQYQTIILFGGVGTDGSTLGGTWEWDGNAWVKVALNRTERPMQRRGHTMQYDPIEKKVLLFGGYNGVFLKDTWGWDSFTKSWTKLNSGGKNSPYPKYQARLGYDQSNSILLLSGGVNNITNPDQDITWKWNWKTNKWETWTINSPHRSSHGFSYYKDGSFSGFILFGGMDNATTTGIPENDTWKLEGDNWLELSEGGPSNRANHSMIYDPIHNQILLYGGELNCSEIDYQECYLQDTWVWDGDWHLKSNSSAPGPRVGASITFDQNREKVVLYGGKSCSPEIVTEVCFESDTWEWDGNSWLLVSKPGEGPGFYDDFYSAFQGCSSTFMTYDETRKVSVLFGCGNETWTWDGTSWEKKNISGDLPAERSDFSLVFDKKTGKVLLFGGYGIGQPVDLAYMNDSWLWDGISWQKQNPLNAPDKRNSHSMSYDDKLGGVVLFGGYNENNPTNNGLLNDTWFWDGTNWILLNPSNSPSPLKLHRMIFHSQMNQTFVFGGYYYNSESKGYSGELWSLK